MEFRTLRQDELETWFDHCDRCFEAAPRDYFVRYYTCDPTARPDNILVAMDGEEIAAALRIVPRRIYIKGRAVPMGGIGDVGTKPAYRKQGLSGKLLDRAIQEMVRRGLDVSALFTGVNSHYAAKGWQTVATRRTVMPVPNAALPANAAVRYFAPEDVAAMRGLYDLYAPEYDGAVLRDSDACWDTWLPMTMKHAHVLIVDGRIQGYAASDHVREDAQGGATFDIAEWIAAPAVRCLFPAVVSEIQRIGNLPGRVRIPRPLWPDAQGEVQEDGHLMLRLNAPIALDEEIATTDALLAAIGEPMLFAADGF